MTFIPVEIKISTPTGQIQLEDLLDLGQSFSNDADLTLIEKPTVEHSKGDGLSIGEILLALSSGSVPVLAQIIFEWYKAHFNHIIELIVTREKRSVSIKMRPEDVDIVTQLIEKLNKLID